MNNYKKVRNVESWAPPLPTELEPLLACYQDPQVILMYGNHFPGQRFNLKFISTNRASPSSKSIPYISIT